MLYNIATELLNEEIWKITSDYNGVPLRFECGFLRLAVELEHATNEYVLIEMDDPYRELMRSENYSDVIMYIAQDTLII